jgi:hypothetical protein
MLAYTNTIRIKGEIGSDIIIVDDFNVKLLSVNRSSRQKNQQRNLSLTASQTKWT